MSDYYILTYNNDPTITGNAFPQIAHHKGWCYDNYSFLSMLKPDVIPLETFQLDRLVLNKKAKLTDFLSDGILFWGFIVSENVRSVFRLCRLPPHRFFAANIEVDHEIVNHYYWFFPIGNMYSLIDFAASKFQISDRFLQKQIVTKDVTFMNISDIKRFEDYNSNLKVHLQSICFTKEVDYDIFQIGEFSFDWIITDRLKKLFDEQCISGFITKKIDWINMNEGSKCPANKCS